MSTETHKTIIEIKKNIQSLVSKLMSNNQELIEDENKLIEKISKYKVATNLEDLSKKFDNVLESPNTGS